MTHQEPEPSTQNGSCRKLRLSERRLIGPEMYRKVFREGRPQRGPNLSLWVYRPSEPQEITRVGFVIRKKTGKAHLRNRLRRVFRALFQSSIPAWTTPAWVVFDVPPRPLKASIRELRAEAESLLSASLR